MTFAVDGTTDSTSSDNIKAFNSYKKQSFVTVNILANDDSNHNHSIL